MHVCKIFYIHILTAIAGWRFTTSHLLSTPSIKDCVFHNNIVSLHFKLFYYYLLTLQFMLRLHDYFQGRNGLDTFVIVTIFLFIPPWRGPHKWQKHVEGYPVIKIHNNTIVNLLVLVLYSFALCVEYEPYKIEDRLIGKLHFYCVSSCYIAFFRILMVVLTYMLLLA